MRKPRVGEKVEWYVDDVVKAVALGLPTTKKGVVTKTYGGEIFIDVKEEGKRKLKQITQHDLASIG